MRIAVAADERVGVADAVVQELRQRGHEVLAHGALIDDERDDWAWASEAAARDVRARAAGDPRRVVRRWAECGARRRRERRARGRHPVKRGRCGAERTR